MATRKKRQVNLLHDNSSGTVNINPGSSSGPTNTGFFGGRFTNTGVSSRKRRRRRLHAQAKQAALAKTQSEAQAQLEQANAAQTQFIDSWAEAYSVRKSELDRAYAQRAASLAQQLESEVTAAVKPPNWNGDERWQLYLINKEKAEIAEVIARKQADLSQKQSAARSFDNHDPLTTNIDHYRHHIALHSDADPAAASNTHQRWENAYTAAHEAKFLSESIRYLSDKFSALTALHAERSATYLKIDAIHEGHRRYAETRVQQIKHALRINEDVRRDLVRAANTLMIRGPGIAGRAVILNRAGAALAAEAAAALEAALLTGARELIRIAAIRVGQLISVGATAMFWSEDLGNGELTPEQRRRLFQGIGVGTDTLGLPAATDLPSLAQAGGSVDLPVRIKTVPVQQGMELHVVSTGNGLPAAVPVIKAEFDALTGTYKAQTTGSSPQYLSFDATVPGPSAVDATELPAIFTGEGQVLEVPAGVDIRIQDCIVCFPAELGWPPRYFTFYVENLTQAW